MLQLIPSAARYSFLIQIGSNAMAPSMGHDSMGLLFGENAVVATAPKFYVAGIPNTWMLCRTMVNLRQP